MVHRGQSAFDWRHLSLGQDIKRAAAAEVKMAAKVKLAMDGTDPITTKLRNRRNCRQVWKLFLARALT